MSLPPDLRSNQTKKAMRKIVLTFGGIAGAIVAFFMFATLPFRHSIEEGGALWVGYTTMAIALSMIFFGIKSYRDNHSMGSITIFFRVSLRPTHVPSPVNSNATTPT